ncbi:MAG: AAA family ATPase, partial [Rubrivivax sp.]
MEATLRLLDAPRLESAAGRFSLPPSVPGFLLAYLGQRGDWITRDSLLALFWPDASPADAQHNLRVSVHRTRHLLQQWSADHLLDSERRRVRMRVGCDVADFRAACGRADWAAAFALHRAPLLGGLALPGFAAVEEWARGERAALSSAWRNAALRHAQALAKAGGAAAAQAATGVLHEALHADVLAEELVQELLRLARAAGQRDAALALFERLRRRLREELQADPLPATLALAAALRLDSGSAPPPSTEPAVPRWPARLMAPPLAGREAELARLAGTLCRIALVSGEPGVGKSRLVEAALPGAVWLGCREPWREVPLQPLTDWLDDMQGGLEGTPAFEQHRRELSRLLPRLWPAEVLPPLASADERSALLAALVALLES